MCIRMISEIQIATLPCIHSFEVSEPDNTFQTDVKTVTLFSLAVTAYRPPNNNNVKSGKSTRIKKKNV